MNSMTHQRLFDLAVKCGTLAALLVLALPDFSWAADADLKGSITKVTSGMKNMPVVLSGIAYLAAGATMLHGCGLLKKHADSPTQQPLIAGVSRIIAGGLIASLPVAITWGVKSFGWGTEGNVQPFPYVPIGVSSFKYINGS